MSRPKSNRGGRREGAGRKRKRAYGQGLNQSLYMPGAFWDAVEILAKKDECSENEWLVKLVETVVEDRIGVDGLLLLAERHG